MLYFNACIIFLIVSSSSAKEMSVSAKWRCKVCGSITFQCYCHKKLIFHECSLLILKCLVQHEPFTYILQYQTWVIDCKLAAGSVNWGWYSVWRRIAMSWRRYWTKNSIIKNTFYSALSLRLHLIVFSLVAPEQLSNVRTIPFKMTKIENLCLWNYISFNFVKYSVDFRTDEGTVRSGISQARSFRKKYNAAVSGGENNVFLRHHLRPIHEYLHNRNSACRYAMTPHDICGSRLLQPLVSVTKIGTQVSCHSKSSFFRSLSIKQYVLH